jgi:hypothetical protein
MMPIRAEMDDLRPRVLSRPTILQPLVIGDLIPYQNDGEGRTAIISDAGRG